MLQGKKQQYRIVFQASFSQHNRCVIIPVCSALHVLSICTGKVDERFEYVFADVVLCCLNAMG